MTFTRVSVAAVTAEPYHFFTCFRQVSVEGDKFFRRCNFMLLCAEIQGYVPETRFFLVSVDVIRQNVDGNTRLLLGNRFLSCFILLTNSDLEGTETLDFFPEILFFSFPLYIELFLHSLFLILFHYSTGKYVVIVRFYTTHTRLLPSVCEIYASLCTITQMQELHFLHSSNEFILLLFFSSIDRPVTINFYCLKSTYIFACRPRHLNIICLKFLT